MPEVLKQQQQQENPSPPSLLANFFIRLRHTGCSCGGCGRIVSAASTRKRLTTRAFLLFLLAAMSLTAYYHHHIATLFSSSGGGCTPPAEASGLLKNSTSRKLGEGGDSRGHFRPSPPPQQPSRWGFLNSSSRNEGKEEQQEQLVPLVLGWTEYYQRDHWDMGVVGFLKRQGVRCSHLCEYTDDRSRFDPSIRRTVIIYHAWDLHVDDLAPTLPGSYFLNVFFNIEATPTLEEFGHSQSYKGVPPDFFNVTMSYRFDSDLWSPYNSLDLVDEDTPMEERYSWEEVELAVAHKTKLAFIAYSHCGAPSGRDEYLQALRQYINVTVLGACGEITCPHDNQRRNTICSENQIEDHLFILSFENSLCRDYMTERFWHMKSLIVPVVLSRRVQFGAYPVELLPPDSYIAADDFESARALAEHLLHLQSNRSAYLRMYEWTRRFKKTHVETRYHVERYNSHNLCALCRMAHEGKEASVPDIVEWWERGSECHSMRE